jgi:hypothetical protein
MKEQFWDHVPNLQRDKQEELLENKIDQLTKERNELKRKLDFEMYNDCGSYRICNQACKERDTLRTKLELAEAACAAKDEALEKVRGYGRADMGHQQMCDYVTEVATEALSTTCGQPILDRVNRLESFASYIASYPSVPIWIKEKAKEYHV